MQNTVAILGQEIKIALKHANKAVSTNTLQLFYKNSNVLQKTANIRKNESILKMAKNGHNAKAIAHAKYSLWVKK